MVCGVLVYLAVLVGHLPLALGLRFHSLFMPGMVVQRDVPTTLWGFDLEGSLDTELFCSTTSGTISHRKLATISTTTREGVWEVEVPPQEAGTVCTLQASTATESLVLTDVLFGDVWLCSGQSNMELTMTNIINSKEEIAASAAFTTIRYMVVGHAVSEAADPDADVAVEQGWADPMDAASLANMSAVCFLYARSLQALWAAEGREVVPLGLVAASWGGTPVEAWTPPHTLATCGVEEVPGCTPDYPHHCPAHLYNAMVLPLTRAALTGFLWYQGEANRVNNRDDYACTFPGMIEAWREAFSSTSATPADAAFGFVQLASWRPDSLEAGFPVIRWHQTADVGYVPNPRMERVFMAVALDTFDEKEGYPGNIHTRYKQVVAERLALTAMAVAYGDPEHFPTHGPVPSSIVPFLQPATVMVHFSEAVTYDSTEGSGFYYCLQPATCDQGNTLESWVEVQSDAVKQVDGSTLSILLPFVSHHYSLAYAWRETPVKRYLGLPVYSLAEHRLPSPPWKVVCNDGSCL